MSDQTNFITKVFNVIKNNFQEFNDVPVRLNIKDYLQIVEEDGRGLACLTTLIKSTLSIDYTILICKDLYVPEIKNPENYSILLETNSVYLTSIGIEISHRSLIVCILLHEFGHLLQKIKFLKHSDIRDLKSLTRINTEFIRVIKRKKGTQDTTFENSLFYNFMFDELYAEMFKFKYFPTIWNLVKDIEID